MNLHLFLQADDLFHRAGQRAADIHHVQDLQRAVLQRHEVLMIATQRRGPDGIAADVKDDRIPVHGEGRGHLSRQGQGLDARVCEVRRHQADFLHLNLFAALGQAEIGVDHIQIQQLGPLAAGGSLEGKVQCQLGFAAAVISDQDHHFFHAGTSADHGLT